MQNFINFLFVIVVVGLAPLIIYLSIRTRNKRNSEKDAIVRKIAERVGGTYVGTKGYFSEKAFAIVNAPIHQLIEFPATVNKSASSFFVIQTYTGQGGRTNAYKYLSHRMIYSTPVSNPTKTHVYISSNVTDLLKEQGKKLPKTIHDTKQMTQHTNQPLQSHTIYSSSTEPLPEALNQSFLASLGEHFDDCDIEIFGDNLYIIGFCGNNASSTDKYESFIINNRNNM